jgi:NADH:ubiquinone oxidoreductase subunit 2 (subunit N)
LAPAYLIFLQGGKMIKFFIVLSGVVGAISQINKKNVSEVLAFSSVFNLS